MLTRMLVALLVFVWPVSSVFSSMQIVRGVGEHRMGDYESKQEAVRLATEAAKRDALEQMASYVDSLTVGKDQEIVNDEIRSSTAGVLAIIQKEVTTRFEGDTLVIHVEVTAQADPEEVARAVTAERQKTKLKPIPFSSRQSKDFLFSHLYRKVQSFADQVFTPQEIEEAALHHRGGKYPKRVCDATGKLCETIAVQWHGLTQEDLDDIKRLNELERRLAIDPESFFNSPSCAKWLLNDACREELQDAGVPYSEILRQNRLRTEARAEEHRKIDETKAAEYRKTILKTEAAEKAEEEKQAKEAAQRAIAQKDKDAAEDKRRRVIDDLVKDIMADRFVPDTPRQARGLAEYWETPQAPIGVAEWIVEDREGRHDPAKWIGEHGVEAQVCSRRPIVDECITVLIHAGFSVNEVGEWIVDDSKKALPPNNSKKDRDFASRREEAKRAGYSDAEISKYVIDHAIPSHAFSPKYCDPTPVSDRCIKGLLEAGFSEREVGAWIVKNSRKVPLAK